MQCSPSAHSNLVCNHALKCCQPYTHVRNHVHGHVPALVAHDSKSGHLVIRDLSRTAKTSCVDLNVVVRFYDRVWQSSYHSYRFTG